MAFAAARLAARFAMSRGARRAAAYSARQAYRSAARAASKAGRYARVWARRNPMTTGFMAGGAAENLVRSTRKRNLKSIRQGRIVKPRKAGPVPSAPSSRVPAKYAVAPRMTKFSRVKPSKEKVPKSAIVHYKEFGQFTSEKCMYINHEHWGQTDKMWKGIGYGLAKLILPKVRVFPTKSMEDPCVGPRTNVLIPEQTFDNYGGDVQIRLLFVSEGIDGVTTRSFVDVPITNQAATPDRYRTFDAIGSDLGVALRDKYNNTLKTWLAEAAIYDGDPSGTIRVNPIYVQNLDDAEINLYVNSLIKLQNVTTSDAGSLDKNSVDANPLVGRMYTAKGHYPHIDSDLMEQGDKTLGRFFGDVDDTTLGITLCGHSNLHTASDVGRVSSIPHARELYGNQLVKSGPITMGAGAMKFHKTTFTLRKTFRALAGVGFISAFGGTGERIGMHTLFGFTLAHKHGEDTINIGYNRDTDVGCYIKHKRIVHPLKTNYTRDNNVISTTIVPTEHQ